MTTVYVGGHGGTEIAREVTELHGQMEQQGWKFADLQIHTENGDTKSAWVTYTKQGRAGGAAPRRRCGRAAEPVAMHDTGRPPRDAVTGSWPAAIAGTDTIVAAATPPGRGGIGVVRVSGPGVPVIAEALLGRQPQPRRATFARFPDSTGEPIDAGIALYFPEPHSLTGEDVLELQGHGGPVILG